MGNQKMAIVKHWTKFGSAMATLMFVLSIFRQYFPHILQHYLRRYFRPLDAFLYPYMRISFNEFTGERFNRSEAYALIDAYLSEISHKVAQRLKGETIKDSQSLFFSADENEEMADVFQGVKVWWFSGRTATRKQSIQIYPGFGDGMRYYKLMFHRRYRELITENYLKHVLIEGKATREKNRPRKLYTNISGRSGYAYSGTTWSHVVFEHPATFETLAMEPKKKEDIINDLVMFTKSKEYYARIGKPWKRGYLLYGPPGTGKSSMIAAMANFLGYDVYDLELTAVKDNTELRKLLIETASRSIIVIEDIDCSLDLTGQREKKKEKKKDDGDRNAKATTKNSKQESESKDSKVTLSGLLNFIDGIWSACGAEKIIVFTTNFKDKLDPALIRRGRMDKHIELSYCRFEAFKILAKNYLGIEWHDLFDTVRDSFDGVEMTPADVAESLMPKSRNDDAETRLRNLIEALETAREEARKRSEEEERKRLLKEARKSQSENNTKEGEGEGEGGGGGEEEEIRGEEDAKNEAASSSGEVKDERKKEDEQVQ